MYAGNTQIVLNTLGDVYGYLYNKAPYQLVDTYYYSYIGSNNAYTVYDSAASATAANSYAQYTRSSKQLGWTIDNVTAYKLTSAYNQSIIPMYIGNTGTNNAVLRMYGSTSGYVGFTVPVAAGSTTYTFPAAPINGYFLQTDSSGTLSWAPASGGGGGVSTVTASLPVVSSGGTNPIISVNASSASTASYLVVRDANADFAGRNITATQFVAGSNFYITLSGTDATIAFDATDYLSYDRTNNQYNFQIGGSGVLASNTTALQSYKPIRIQGSTSGYVGFAAQAVAGGTTYTWPSSPIADYFLKTDGSGNLSWAAASGGVTSVTATSPVFSSGGATPNITVNASSANTNSYIVQRDANGDFSAGTITATQYTVAANYYLTLSSSNPNIIFDTNDYIAYSRSTNEYIFYVNGAARLNINASNVATYTNVSINGLSLGTGPGTGINNTIFGDTAGSALNLGANNTVVGALALGSSVNSGSHCAFGYGALNAVNAGQQNSAFGFAALSASTNITNSSGFGNGAAVTGDNQVQLGNSSTTTYVYGTVQNRSDLRDKADVRDTQLGLGFINALRPVDYKWDARDDYKPPMPEDLTDKEAMAAWREACDLSNITHDGSKKRSRYHHGLIAQEVKAVLDAQGIDFGGYQDHKVKGGQDVLTIGYDELIAPLIKAIQELTARVQELEAKA